MKESENILLSFWANDPLKHAVERDYFKLPYFTGVNEMLNTNQIALEVKGLYDHQRRIMFFVTSLLASLMLPTYGIAKIVHSAQSHTFNKLSKRLIGAGSALFSFISMSQNNVVQGGASILAGTYCALSSKEEYEWARDNIILLKNLQEKLREVSHYIMTLHDIAKYVESSSLPENLEFFEYLKDAFDSTKQKAKIKELINLLQSTTLQEESSLFFTSAENPQGKILAAYRLFHELKNEFDKAILAASEIDAYTSVAKLYKEFEHKRVRYSFAEFRQENKPIIELADFWNPFINSESVVVNSLSLGIDNSSHVIILSGPNEAGKSTLIKAIVITLIMTHCFGIGPAQNIILSPFSKIGTYLNIHDDIAAGNSVFKAQVLRVEHLLSQAKRLKQDEHCFLAFDEMFNGTRPAEASVLVRAVGLELASHPNFMCILATHFPLLTRLEAENSNFVNYRVSATVKENGKIYYPYRIERGISDQNVAIDILRQEGFESTILDEASDMLAKIQ